MKKSVMSDSDGSTFRVDCPDCMEDTVLKIDYGNSGYDGTFENNEARMHYLGQAADAINTWIENKRM